MRRLVEIFLALLLIALTAPLWFIIIVAIVVTSPGAPFFTQARVGKDGELFRLVKFRSMRPLRTHQPDSPQVTAANDRRITAVGRLLRRSKLDEIPQLLNILTGSMTFVGPRPETPELFAKYPPALRAIIDYRPGLTDPGSVKYRYEEKILASYLDPVAAYLEHVMPDKVARMLEYQKRRTVLTDIRVVAATVAAIFRPSSDVS